MAASLDSEWSRYHLSASKQPMLVDCATQEHHRRSSISGVEPSGGAGRLLRLKSCACGIPWQVHVMK